jgi:hypothetical protein
MKETNVKQSHYLSLKHGKMNGTCNRRQEKKILIYGNVMSFLFAGHGKK